MTESARGYIRSGRFIQYGLQGARRTHAKLSSEDVNLCLRLGVLPVRYRLDLGTVMITSKNDRSSASKC